ncbi:Os06g0616001 [Oryza sativa Japonica Group]|uniref:Os06g0616001 protein n=1 Tax=Oryza sativa subsp. japonica TaxID=39947 RepID=A0A0P0WYS0_ORYSJ|nr:Os06g0616001 [Oryza sativa Japonica Group]
MPPTSPDQPCGTSRKPSRSHRTKCPSYFREDECERLLTRAAEGDGSRVEPRGDALRRRDVEHDKRAVRAKAEVVGGRPLSSLLLMLTPACICVGG